MSNRICPVCGEEYADWATSCSDCRVALVEPTEIDDLRLLPETQQVVYELGDWTLDQHTEVAAALAEAGIAHTWDGDELIVHVSNEAAVDALLEPIDRDNDRGPAPEGSETEYDMSEWPAEERAVVVTRLEEAGVPYRWEDDLLLVPVADESVVDDILDDVEEGGDAAALIDDGAETPFEVLESLFLAAGRLRHDAIDGEGVSRLADALDVADPDRPPFGVDIAVWHRVMAAADQVADAVGNDDGVDPDTAMEAAERLHGLLRPYV